MGGEEGLVVGGADIVGVGSGKDEQMGVQRTVPVGRGPEFGGGVFGVAREGLRFAAGGDTGEVLAVVLVVAEE